MDLDTALYILARVHTSDDQLAGFVVHAAARPEWGTGVSQHEYIEAWEAVRKHLHQPTDPASV